MTDPVSVFPLPTPHAAVRSALIASLYREHRPELADLIETAELCLDFPGLWVWPDPSFASLRPAWLEDRLLSAAPRSRFPDGVDSCLAGTRTRAAMTPQRSWCCRVCGHAERVALGFCRACYDRRRRSEVFFGGYRELVLKRDRCCRVCLQDQTLVVHHRQPGRNRPAVHITLCRRCHARVHHRHRLPGFYSPLFFRLWSEAHPGWAAQLRLPLAA